MDRKLSDPLQTRYEHFMNCADTAEEHARKMRDQDGREEWQRVAKGWRDLAVLLQHS